MSERHPMLQPSLYEHIERLVEDTPASESRERIALLGVILREREVTEVVMLMQIFDEAEKAGIIGKPRHRAM